MKDLRAALGPGKPTRLLDALKLATRCGVKQVLVKNEAERELGNFKSLGGLRAGLNALARAVGAADGVALIGNAYPELPQLIAASAGNHGLAVAAAAQLAGTRARIYVHAQVPRARAQRILDVGAELIEVHGSYDDAVELAARAAEQGEGILIADTSRHTDDLVVRDVMQGYQRMAFEIIDELDRRDQILTHVFVQAGVGGLAAAMAAGLHEHASGTPWLAVVEPVGAACVAAAIEAGEPIRLPAPPTSAAGMLACGEASAPALEMLKIHHPALIALPDEDFVVAQDAMMRDAGVETTLSGAAGLAGLLAAGKDARLASRLGLNGNSRVLVIATEGP